MRIRSLVPLVAATFLFASAALADDAPAAPASAKGGEPRLGEKSYKERINLVARKPLRRDIEEVKSWDRTSWNGFTTWQGVRDERPIIARKTMGFHDPRPHRTRMERVLLVSRGPIRGPGFTE
jgi:hypothetical protein